MDPTVVHRRAGGAGERPDAPPPATVVAGGQVLVGQIPAPRPGFQPRPGLLAQLGQSAERPSAAVLTGAPGSGKTELAATYARARLAGGWPLVAWLNAQDGRSLLTGLAEVAEAVGLSGRGSPSPAADTGRLVRPWLEADGSRCLLVFDGAEDPGVLRPFVPAAGAARIVITAAQGPMTELGASVPVGAFSAEEALAVLGGRTGRADEADASAVAAELAHLPLALDLAAAVIAQQHLTYAEFLARLQATAAGQVAPPAGPEPAESQQRPYRGGVADAVRLSVDIASGADRLGVCTGVLELMALLSRAGVHREVLHAAGEAGTLLGRGRRVAASMVDRALERLIEQALLGFSLDGQVVTMHSLVARVVRDDMMRRGRFVAACGAAAGTLELPGAVQDTICAQNDLAHAYREAGRIAEAVQLLERSLAAEEQLLGPDHASTLAARNNLGSAYRAAGRPAEAVAVFEQNAVACERLLGADHPRTVASRHSLDLARREAEPGRSG